MARYPLSLPSQLKQEAEALAAGQGISLNQFVLWAVAEKVGSLRSLLDDSAYPRITYRRGANGRPRPVLRGTNLHVQTIVVATKQWGQSPAELAENYGVSQAQVDEALAFYLTHGDEIDAAIMSEEALEPGCD